MSIEQTIEILTTKITNDVQADDALKLTQAALNLAQTAAVLGLTKNV